MYYCPVCWAQFAARPYHRTTMEESWGVNYCPNCGHNNVRSISDELKNQGWAQVHYLPDKVKNALEEEHIKDEVELTGGLVIERYEGFAKKEETKKISSQVLVGASSNTIRRFEKVGETEEEIAIVRDGVPLYFEKDEPEKTRKQYFKLNEKKHRKKNEKDLKVLYDNDGRRFGSRIKREEASQEVKTEAMAKALQS